MAAFSHHRREIRLLLAAVGVSSFGDSALFIALGIWVRELTGSASLAGLTFFCYALGGLLAPVAGVIVDRVPRRAALIGTNLAVSAAILPLLLVRSHATVVIIYPVLVLYGFAGMVISSAQSALVPSLVSGRDEIGKLNGLSQTMQQTLRVLSPGVGAGLFALLGGRAVVLIDIVTFLVAAAIVSLLHVERPKLPSADETSRESLLKEAGAGARFLIGLPVLRQLVLAGAMLMLVAGFTETIFFPIATTELHHSPSFVGILASVVGVGGVAGAFLGSALIKKTTPGLLTTLGLLLFGVGSLGLLIPVTPAVVLAMAIQGSAVSPLIIGISTALETTAPQQVLGRAAAALQLSLTLPQTISIALGAGLLAVTGYRPLLIAMGAVVLAVALYLGSRPEQRRPFEPDTQSATRQHDTGPQREPGVAGIEVTAHLATAETPSEKPEAETGRAVMDQ